MFKERVFKVGPWEEGGDADNMWMKIATCIRKVASEEFGVSRGRRSEDCWKYALEAIIKALLLYFLVHDNRLYS